MKPSNAPVSAIPIPPPRGPNPTEQLDTIAGIRHEIERENAVNRGNFDTGCANWTLANLRNRDFGLPIQPKPEPFIPQVFIAAPDTDPFGVVWIWTEPGLPAICPDLPPVVEGPGPDHIHIGIHYYGNFWKAAADNAFNGTDPIPGNSDDGVTGTWQFIGSPAGPGRGWFQKVG